jgi:hypothetical protein
LGVRGGLGRGQGGEMTQTLYAHMNKIKIKKNNQHRHTHKKDVSEDSSLFKVTGGEALRKKLYRHCPI